MRAVATVVLAAALLLLGGVEGQAQDWRDLVGRQLDGAAEIFEGRGYSAGNVLQRDQIVGVLDAGGRAYLEVELEGGVEYLFTGVCDQDCSDLDLYLHESAGFEALASDVEVDDVPIITYTAPQTGGYLLGISMADCEASICYFGVRVYRN